MHQDYIYQAPQVIVQLPFSRHWMEAKCLLQCRSVWVQVTEVVRWKEHPPPLRTPTTPQELSAYCPVCSSSSWQREHNVFAEGLLDERARCRHSLPVRSYSITDWPEVSASGWQLHFSKFTITPPAAEPTVFILWDFWCKWIRCLPPFLLIYKLPSSGIFCQLSNKFVFEALYDMFFHISIWICLDLICCETRMLEREQLRWTKG